MVRYVLLRPLRPELDVIQNNCRVRFVGISRYVHFSSSVKSVEMSMMTKVFKIQFYWWQKSLKYKFIRKWVFKILKFSNRQSSGLYPCRSTKLPRSFFIPRCYPDPEPRQTLHTPSTAPNSRRPSASSRASLAAPNLRCARSLSLGVPGTSGPPRGHSNALRAAGMGRLNMY
jgi:hypothetical protein